MAGGTRVQQRTGHLVIGWGDPVPDSLIAGSAQQAAA